MSTFVAGTTGAVRAILSGTSWPRLKLVCVAKPPTFSLGFARVHADVPAPAQLFSWTTGFGLGHVTAARALPPPHTRSRAMAPRRRVVGRRIGTTRVPARLRRWPRRLGRLVGSGASG